MSLKRTIEITGFDTVAFPNTANPTLEGCPPEILEGFVQYLDLEDICSLRLVSRCLANKATQETFKSHFITKHVNIDNDSLQTFVQMTKPGWMGSLVENIILVGTAIDTKHLEQVLQNKARWVTTSNGPIWGSTQHRCTPEELAQVKRDVQVLKRDQATMRKAQADGSHAALLGEAFRNLATNSKSGKLRSVSFDIVVIREDINTKGKPEEGGDWGCIWKAAASAFHTCMTALGSSALPIDELDIFSTIGRCSLSCYELSQLDFDASGLAASLQNLKSLSLSLSERIFKQDPAKMANTVRRNINAQENNFTGLPNLLRLAPNLESLHVHWFKVYLEPEDQSEKVFAHLAGSVLHKLQIKSLSIENVHMTSGKWTQALNYCTRGESTLEYLYLDDLWEEMLMLFDGVSTLKFMRMEPQTGGETLERSGLEVKQPLTYHYPTAPQLGSPQVYNWSVRRRQEFGPP